MKRTNLRASLIKQINEIGAGLREQEATRTPKQAQVLLSTQNPFYRLMVSLFSGVYKDSHTSMWAKDFNALAPFFGLSKLDETGKYISNPDAFNLRITSVSADDAEVVVGILQSVGIEIPETEEPIMEWVTVNEDTKVRRQATDATGALRFKKVKTQESHEARVFEYHFATDLFVDLFKEIGRESILDVPKNYTPAPLGVNVGRFLYDSVMPMPFMGRGGPDRFEQKMMMMSMHPRHTEPVRIFLKPEKGTDRMEVIFEPYRPEEIEAHRALTEQRRNWANFQVRDTKTVKAFLKLIPKAPAEKIKETAG